MSGTDRMSAAEFKARGGVKVPTEHEECRWLYEWAESQRWNGWKVSEILVHVPNGAYHGADREAGAVVARKLREQGLKPGVPDYILPVPMPQLKCSGLWIEMKRTRRGVVSEDQEKFMTRMRELGWQCNVCKGWIEAAQVITEYLQLKGRVG